MRSLLVFLMLNTLPAHPQNKVVEAYDLWISGQTNAAIEILEPMLTANEPGLQGAELGVAWGLLGSSYQTVESYGEAGRAYQKALDILGPLDAAKTQYAALLDNMATMDEELGQLDAAGRLCEKALRIYQDLGDHSGMTVAHTDLAVIAFSQSKIKPAQQHLEQALADAKAGGSMGDEDAAALNSVKAALALRAGHADEAVAAAQIAIDCWIRSRGPGYFMLGTTYMIEARALAKSGKYADALVEAQHALDLAESAVGRDSNAYLKAKGVLAAILRASGNREEASRMQKEVQRSLADLHARQCFGCTVDVRAFRRD